MEVIVIHLNKIEFENYNYAFGRMPKCSFYAYVKRVYIWKVTSDELNFQA